MFHVLALGFAMGLFASATPGPINVEVVRRALSRGPKLGFAFGMGAVTADVLYAAAAALGALALVNSFNDKGKAGLYFVGAVMLMVIGVRALLARPRETPGFNDDTQVIESLPAMPAYSTSVLRAYVVGFALTFASPGTVFYWIFANIGSAKLVASHLQNPATYIAAGVAIACTLWVSMACYVAGKMHRRVQPETYILVDRIAGSILVGFALYSFSEGLRLFF